MDAKDLKNYLAGLGIAGLLAGGSAIAADKPAGKADEAKSAPTATTMKSEPTKTAPAKGS
jgi:radical SAM modification target selenobiotic family peptide